MYQKKLNDPYQTILQQNIQKISMLEPGILYQLLRRTPSLLELILLKEFQKTEFLNPVKLTVQFSSNSISTSSSRFENLVIPFNGPFSDKINPNNTCHNKRNNI